MKPYRTTISNLGEARFAAELDAAGKIWFHQPKVFTLPPPLYSYRPDFYVVEDRAFYEVCATRQAYSYARTRIAAFRVAYPHLKLEVFNAGAWVKKPAGPRVVAPIRSSTPAPVGMGIETILRDSSCALVRSVFTLAVDRGYRTIVEVARLVGKPYGAVRHLGDHRCASRLAGDSHGLANLIFAALEAKAALRA